VKVSIARFILVLMVLLASSAAFSLIQVDILPFNSGGVDRMPWLHGDILYFVSGSYDIYQVTYKNGVWGIPEPVRGSINTKQNEINPCVIERDGKLIMYFARYTGKESDYDFFRAIFDEEKEEWCEVKKVPELSTDTQDWDIWVNANETVVYLTTKGVFSGTTNVGGRDIWCSKRRSPQEKWPTPFNVTEVNTSGNEWSVFVDPLGLIWFDSSRDDSLGGYEIYAYDPSTGKLIHYGMALNSLYDERSMWTDGEVLLFTSKGRKGGVGGYDIYIAYLK